MEINVLAILFQMLNFGIVVGALTFLLFKPVRKILDERSRKVAEGQAAAEDALKEKARIAQHAEQVELNAKQQAKQLIADARSDASERKNELLEEAKAEVEAAREKMLKNLDKEKAAAFASWQAEFETAVIAVAEQVIGASLDAKKHSKLIDEGLKEIAASK